MSVFRRPLIMGIINATPDSFYSGSRRQDTSHILQTAESMINDGADILDIGGESTRPGSESVPADEQIRRLIPAIREIRDRYPVDISVDTQSAQVAEEALNAGATMINDISAMNGDPEMGVLAAERDVRIVLMHMKGTPGTMQQHPYYDDVVTEVGEYLSHAADRAIEAGIPKENILLDPGIGFGKRLQDNVLLLKQLNDLRVGGIPLLVGLSRKSFLGLILDADEKSAVEKIPKPHPPEDRLVASIAAGAWCLAQDVDVLRVHDVRETREMIAVWEAIAWAS